MIEIQCKWNELIFHKSTKLFKYYKYRYHVPLIITTKKKCVRVILESLLHFVLLYNIFIIVNKLQHLSWAINEWAIYWIFCFFLGEQCDWINKEIYKIKDFTWKDKLITYRIVTWFLGKIRNFYELSVIIKKKDKKN